MTSPWRSTFLLLLLTGPTAIYSRQDAYFGDPNPFNQAAWDETLEYWQDDYINITTSAAAHASRIRTSNATNPDFGLSSVAKGFLSGESIAFIMVFGNVDTGVVDAQSVKYWFGESSLGCPTVH